jgi:hypothetical protein
LRFAGGPAGDADAAPSQHRQDERAEEDRYRQLADAGGGDLPFRDQRQDLVGR